MRRCNIALALVLMTFILMPVALTSQEKLGLDWRVSHLLPATGSTFSEKSEVTLRCEWDAAVAATGTFSSPIDWEGSFTVDGAIVHNFKGKYEPNGHTYIKPGTTGGTDFPWQSPDVFGAATNEFHGSAEAAWPANGIGTHSIGCTIAQSGTTLEAASKKGNNAATGSIIVKAIGQVTPAEFPHSTPALKPAPAGGQTQGMPPGGPVLAKPNLAVIGAQPKIDPTCQTVSHVLDVVVTIRNSSLPLGAGKGTVSVKEWSGANLASAGFPLPAIGTNETKAVTVPVGTTAQFAGALSGSHTLSIVLSPQIVNGQPSFVKPTTDFPLAVTFPAGYCKGK